jgi:hypothetical protein
VRVGVGVGYGSRCATAGAGLGADGAIYCVDGSQSGATSVWVSRSSRVVEPVGSYSFRLPCTQDSSSLVILSFLDNPHASGILQVHFFSRCAPGAFLFSFCFSLYGL